MTPLQAGYGKPRRPGCLSCRRVAGFAAIFLLLFVLVVYLFMPAGMDDDGRWASCLGQIKEILIALIDYADIHQGHLPAASRLATVVSNEVHEDPRLLLECAEPGPLRGVKHVMVKRWERMPIAEIPDPASAIVLYDEVDGRPAFRRNPHYENRFQQLRNLLQRPGLGIGYADGHCEWRIGLTQEMIEEGRDPSRTRR